MIDRRAPAPHGMRGWLIVAAVVAVMTSSGCQLPRRDGPNYAPLVQSRRLTQQGRTAHDRRRPRQAESFFAKAVEACPADPEARFHYADALWRRGARADALHHVNEALWLVPNDPKVQRRWAQMQFELGDDAAALRAIESALDVDPKSAEAWFLHARIMRRRGDLQRAVNELQQALRYDPENQQILYHLAETYHLSGKPHRALPVLHNLADLSLPGQQPPQLLHLTGMTYKALGRWEEAADQLLAVRAGGQVTPDLLHQLADAQWRAGRFEEARLAAREAIALNPKHTPTLALLRNLDLARRPGGVTR